VKATSTAASTRRPVGGISASALLDALPHPVVLVDGDNRVAEANDAAETFFQASANVLRRHAIAHFVPFGSPLLTLIDHARSRTATVNEYRVDIGTPRNGMERIVDIYATPVQNQVTIPSASRIMSSLGSPFCTSCGTITMPR
jgi:two-component system nitrogen regulation sensor histidine kinase GlnL